MTTPFPCDFDKEFDMKSFQETASCAGEVPRARSPSTRTARARTPERNISSPTSFQTVRTRSEAAWGFADDFDRKSRSRFWPYDAKSTFTNLSGSFESLDPFSRQHHGNFEVPPSIAKRIGKVQPVAAIELPTILVTGGLNLDTGISSSVVAFDPSFNTLQQCSVLPTPLHHHRTVLVNSDVIVVGGMLESVDGPYLCTRRCYRLNVAKMQWNRVADLKTERAHHGLVYCDGRILALGGLTLGRRLVSTMEYYDVKRNKWTKMKGSLPQPMMAMGVALFRSLVWVAGGVVGSTEDDLACCTAVHCYDPRTKSWTSTVPPLPRACAYLGLICASGSLVALGGSVSLDQLQPGSLADVLRLSDDQRCWEPLASMPRPCHSSDAVVFGEALYMFGGISDGHVLADVHQLHKGRWSLCAHLPASVLGPSVVALPGPHARETSTAVSSTSDSGDNNSYQPRPLETTSRQTQPFDQSRTLVVGSPTGVTTASKTQHQRLATLRPSARCNATRVVRPRRLHAAKQRLSRERSRRPRRRGEAMLFVYTTSIHPASVVVSTTQEMQRKIPLRHLSKVSM
ncbi:hypothetical protein MRX96_033037 [Rhipicephalus microplus]